MAVKNFEMLGRRWTYIWSIPETLTRWREVDERFQNAPDPRARAAQLRQKLFYPALQHLGFGDVDRLPQQIGDGVSLAVEYFQGDWWQSGGIGRLKPEEMQRFGLTDSVRIAKLIDENSRAMDRRRPDRSLQWYEALTSGLFLGGLIGRWDDLEKICSWFDATIEPEYQAGQIEDEYMQLFICIAGGLNPQPTEGMAELLAKVKKCRTKRPRLLCAAWEAARDADQAAFNKYFKESVAHFLSKPHDGQIYDWLAVHQSAVWFIAERNGLKFPPLPETLQAAVVTRQSVGLADDESL